MTRLAWLTLGRAAIGLAVVAVVALGAVVAFDEGPGPSAPTATSRAPTPSSGSPLAGRRYVTIGTTNGQQFTEAEYRTIADSYAVVVLAKFHAGWDVELHHEAIRRLKELNPNLLAFAYMSTKYWFDANRWGDAQIEPDWFLRDDSGEVVRVTAAAYDSESKDLGSYVDVADPDYRTWLLEVARTWMAAAPYDGIRFDAADPIGDHGERDIAKWEDLLSPERIEGYNNGIVTLLGDFEAAYAKGDL